MTARAERNNVCPGFVFSADGKPEEDRDSQCP